MRVQRAKDETWRAWWRLGVDPLKLMPETEPVGPLVRIANAAAPAVFYVTREVLDEMEVDLDEDAAERVLVTAAQNVVCHAPWAIVDAIADELARIDPVPFDPPPAGSWVRSRSLPPRHRHRARPRLVPEWSGPWHLFSGDLFRARRGLDHVRGRARCGFGVTLRALFDEVEPIMDFVAITEVPTVDVCRTCLRLSGAVPQ